MIHHNDLIVKGRTIAEDGLHIVYVAAVVSSGTNTLVVDWSKGNYWLIDLTAKVGEVLTVTFLNNTTTGAENNRLIFKQASGTACTVTISETSLYQIRPTPDTNFYTALNTVSAITVIDMVFDAIPVSAAAGTYRINNGGSGTTYIEDRDYVSAATSISSTIKVLVQNDTYTLSLARLDKTLGKLIPPLPKLLSDMIYVPTPSQLLNQVRKSSDGTLVARLIQTDTVTFGLSVANNGEFYDPESGTLTAFIQTNALTPVSIGSKALTTGDDSGTYGMLQITTNNPSVTTPFYKALKIININI